MSPKTALLILAIMALLGSSVMGFLYYKKINNELSYSNTSIEKQTNSENSKNKPENSYKEGTDEYYNDLIREINDELDEAVKDNGKVNKEEFIRANNEIREIVRMKINSMTKEEKKQREMLINNQKKEIEELVEKISKDKNLK